MSFLDQIDKVSGAVASAIGTYKASKSSASKKKKKLATLDALAAGILAFQAGGNKAPVPPTGNASDSVFSYPDGPSAEQLPTPNPSAWGKWVPWILGGAALYVVARKR